MKSRGGKGKGVPPPLSVDQLEEDMTSLKDIVELMETGDRTTARTLWMTNSHRTEAAKNMMHGSSSSTTSSVASTPNNMSILAKELGDLQQKRSSMYALEMQSQDRRRKSTSYPNNVLLQLDQGHHALSDQLRHSVTHLEAKIEAIQQNTRHMRADQLKWESIVKRFEQQMYGGKGQISGPSGVKKTIFTSDSFVDEIVDRHALERAALEAKIHTMIDQQEQNEQLIMDHQKPKIEVLRKHLSKLESKGSVAASSTPQTTTAAAGSGIAAIPRQRQQLTRQKVLLPHERLLTVQELLDLAKKKEELLKEKKMMSSKRIMAIEKELIKMDLVLRQKTEELQTVQTECLSKERRRRRRVERGELSSLSGSSSPVHFHPSARGSPSPKNASRGKNKDVPLSSTTPLRDTDEESVIIPAQSYRASNTNSSQKKQEGAAGASQGLGQSQILPEADHSLIVDEPTLASIEASSLQESLLINAALHGTTTSHSRSVSPVSQNLSPSARRTRQQKKEEAIQAVGDEEALKRTNLKRIEKESYRLLKASIECDLIDAELKQRRRGAAKITFTERGRPVMKERGPKQRGTSSSGGTNSSGTLARESTRSRSSTTNPSSRSKGSTPTTPTRVGSSSKLPLKKDLSFSSNRQQDAGEDDTTLPQVTDATPGTPVSSGGGGGGAPSAVAPSDVTKDD